MLFISSNVIIISVARIALIRLI